MSLVTKKLTAAESSNKADGDKRGNGGEVNYICNRNLVVSGKKERPFSDDDQKKSFEPRVKKIAVDMNKFYYSHVFLRNR